MSDVPTLAAVIAARARIGSAVNETPLLRSTRLGDRFGRRLYLKCENLQTTGSFKVRGALNAVRQLSDAQRRAGVVTVSAGNHAQALAWAASMGGGGSHDAGGRSTRDGLAPRIPCTVVMPASASRTKVEASEGYGARVLFEPTALEAFERAQRIADEDGVTFVHPFDHAHIVAGTGTVGLEILDRLPDVGVVIVPVGGGGLLGGVALAIKECARGVRVIGVEPAGASAMRQSLDAGAPMRIDRPQTIADGLAAPMVGALTYELAKRYADDVVVVQDDAIAEALRLILSYTKLLTEPAGAAGVAALLSGLIPEASAGPVVAILSGGNVDLPRLAELL